MCQIFVHLLQPFASSSYNNLIVFLIFYIFLPEVFEEGEPKIKLIICFANTNIWKRRRERKIQELGWNRVYHWLAGLVQLTRKNQRWETSSSLKVIGTKQIKEWFCLVCIRFNIEEVLSVWKTLVFFFYKWGFWGIIYWL